MRPDSQRYDDWFHRTLYLKRFAKGLPDYYVVLGVLVSRA
jgi:hypothetical protein